MEDFLFFLFFFFFPSHKVRENKKGKKEI